MAASSKRSSFHTICVLEGLLECERTRGAATAVTHARVCVQNYLLERRMLRSLTSGEVIDRRWTRFSFPSGLLKCDAGALPLAEHVGVDWTLCAAAICRASA